MYVCTHVMPFCMQMCAGWNWLSEMHINKYERNNKDLYGVLQMYVSSL